MAQPPKKPAPKKPVKLPPGHRTRPIEQETAGKLYLVRDKDYGDGEPVMWATNLAYELASKLKEIVAVRRLSTTVRAEEQTEANAHYLELAIDPRSPHVPLPAAPYGTSFVGKVAMQPEVVHEVGIFAIHPPVADKRAAPSQVLSKDPSIAAAQAAALGAAGGMAAEANRRHEELKAKEAAFAGVAELKPLPMPEIATEQEAAEEGGVDIGELLAGGGDVPTPDEIAAAAADLDPGAAPPVNLLELAIATEVCSKCNAPLKVKCTDPSGPITAHAERIQAAAAKLPPATPTDIDPVTGSPQA